MAGVKTVPPLQGPAMRFMLYKSLKQQIFFWGDVSEAAGGYAATPTLGLARSARVLCFSRAGQQDARQRGQGHPERQRFMPSEPDPGRGLGPVIHR